MDPYLESRWGDVHTNLITYARDQLQRQMPRDLRVRVEEHVTVQVAGGGNGPYPDVFAVGKQGAEIATAEPLLVPLTPEEQTQRSLQIIDTHSGNCLVTALEILGPINKSGEGQADYRHKQASLWRKGVNLVEIDLLRDGPYVLTAPAHNLPLPYLVPYRICVVQASSPGQAEVYRTSLRERLPAIRVPLRETDPDARLDLQELIDKAYENGGYDAEIDYRVDPFPPLQGDDAQWADALLREKGLR
jgi:hypothetical protein